MNSAISRVLGTDMRQGDPIFYKTITLSPKLDIHFCDTDINAFLYINSYSRTIVCSPDHVSYSDPCRTSSSLEDS